MENPNGEQKQKRTLEYINSLPMSTIIVGDRQRNCRIDNTDGSIYLLDEDGKPTGQVARKHLPVKEPVQEIAQKLDLSDTAGATDDPDSEEEEETEEENEEIAEVAETELSISEKVRRVFGERNRPFDEENLDEQMTLEAKKKRIIRYAVIAAIAVVLCFIIVGTFKNVFANKLEEEQQDAPVNTTEQPAATETNPMNETTEPTEETENPTTSTEETVPPTEATAETMIYVITATNTLLPGQELNLDDFAFTEVTKEEFYRLCSFGGLYTEEEIDQLIGLEAAEFIPGGSFITYNAVTKEYAPINPWGRTDTRQTTLRLPVTIEPKDFMSYLIGNTVDITIEVQTKVSTPADKEEDEDEEEQKEVDGMEHHTSTVESMVVDTYVVQAAVVVDLLDKYQSSLYPKYASLASIPVVFQEEMLRELLDTPKDLEAIIPSYIVVAVTLEQGTALQELPKDNMKVTIKTGEPTASTTLQQDTYMQMRELLQSVVEYWETFWEENKNG